MLQALLRNPLATPFTLGVSSGASLGAMVVIIFGVPLSFLGVQAVPLASFAGSLVAVSIVYTLARIRRYGLSINVLLLAGVTLNSLFSAIIMFVQYLADFAQSFRAIRWIMGNLDVSSYDPIVSALPMLGLAFVAFATLPRSLNLLALGPDHATTRGVDVLRAQRLAFVSASLANGRGGVGRRTDRVHRDHRSPRRAIARRVRPPDRPTGVCVSGRRVSRDL